MMADELTASWVSDGIASIIVVQYFELTTEIECFSLALRFMGKIRKPYSASISTVKA